MEPSLPFVAELVEESVEVYVQVKFAQREMWRDGGEFRNSTILHKRTARVLFAYRRIEKIEVVVYYHGNIVYECLLENPFTSKICEEGDWK